MRSKLTISALAIASFLATTAVASAQNEPGQSTPGVSGETTKSHATHHRMKSTHAKPGVTTGMSHRSSTAKSKPAAQPASPKTY
jgi:hypothetical protein